MYTERAAIEDELRDNRNSIKDLRDRNGELLKRLREIDERDMKDNTSFDALDSLTESLTEIIGRMGDLIPHVPVAAVIEHFSQKMDPNMVEEPSAAETAQTKVQEEAQMAKIQSKPMKTFSAEKTSSIIKEIIQEHGKIKTRILEKEFTARTGKKYANFNEQIRKAMDTFPSIQRVGKGAYMFEKKIDRIQPFDSIKETENEAVLI